MAVHLTGRLRSPRRIVKYTKTSVIGNRGSAVRRAILKLRPPLGAFIANFPVSVRIGKFPTCDFDVTNRFRCDQHSFWDQRIGRPPIRRLFVQALRSTRLSR